MDEKINILYCGINSHLTEHGRAKQIYTRLAEKQNINITWIDPPRFTKNMEINLKNLKNYINKYKKKFFENINGYIPIGLPFYLRSGLMWDLTEKMVTKFINDIELKCDILIISSPIYIGYVKLKKKQGIPIIYDCRDLFSGWDHIGNYAIEKEKELLSICDFVIIPSQSLKEVLLEINPDLKIITIHNGVSKNTIRKDKIFKNINISNPTIGFIGYMGFYVDYDLLLIIAKEKPEWNFIIIGNYTKIKKIVMKAPDNCNFLGEIQYEELDKIYNKFDVCILPFKILERNHVAFPIKLVEYFAHGIPVVSTPLRELENLEESNLIHFANTKNEWIIQIENALKDCRHDEFIEFAQKYTWEEATNKYIQCFENILN